MKLLSRILKQLKTYFSEREELKKQSKILGKPNRSQKIFNDLYAHSSMGNNSYGVPAIKYRHSDAKLTIGNYCSIAKNVEIYLGGNHRDDWVSTYPFPRYFAEAAYIKGSDGTRGNVTIGSDVWLCQNTTILSGVTIGHGAVVANGAIVTKDVAAYEIVGGNPAKHIRWRFDESTRAALLKSAWWDWPEHEVLSVVELLCSDNISTFIDYVKNRKSE